MPLEGPALDDIGESDTPVVDVLKATNVADRATLAALDELHLPGVPRPPHTTLRKLLGTGGCSRVYEGVDDERGIRVAVKISQDTPGAIGMLHHEGVILEHIRNMQMPGDPIAPDIIRSGVFLGGLPYVSMQRCAASEREVIEHPNHVASIAYAAASMAELSALVARLHRKLGIIHTDLKSGNVLLDIYRERDGAREKLRRLVCDYGFALTTSHPVVDDDQDVVPCTPLYCAPEQVYAHAVLSEKSDVYALGVMAFELVTGKTPFAGLADAMTVMRTKAQANVLAAKDETLLRRCAPAGWADWIIAMLAREPGPRPTVRQVRDFFCKEHLLRNTWAIPRDKRSQIYDPVDYYTRLSPEERSMDIDQGINTPGEIAGFYAERFRDTSGDTVYGFPGASLSNTKLDVAAAI